MYNNPAFQMFLMATLDRYWARKPEARWPAGVDNMLIVSVGTGTSPDVRTGPPAGRDESAVQRDDDPVRPDVRRLERTGSALPRVRRLSRRRSDRREIGDLIGGVGPLGQTEAFDLRSLDAELSRAGLDRLQRSEVNPESSKRWNHRRYSPPHEVEKKVAELKVDEAQFRSVPPAWSVFGNLGTHLAQL